MKTTPKPINLPNDLALAVRIAVFAERHGIPARDVCQMIAHARRSKSAYERDDSAAEQRHGAAVESIAAEYGCKVDWPGLWPCVTSDNGGNDQLPA